MFNKELYRARRENGMRGQGFPFKRSYILRNGCMFPDDPTTSQGADKPLSRYAKRKNTKRARKYAARQSA